MPKDITIQHEFAVPADRVFAALDDHANMGAWLGPRVSVVKQVGQNGVGTVRRIHGPLMAIDEEVIARDAPFRLAYRIVRGAPGVSFHHGEIQVQPRTDGRCWVKWQVALDSRHPLFTALMLRVVETTLRRGLHRLERQLS